MRRFPAADEFGHSTNLAKLMMNAAFTCASDAEVCAAAHDGSSNASSAMQLVAASTAESLVNRAIRVSKLKMRRIGE
jgi:hypothetical protein